MDLKELIEKMLDEPYSFVRPNSKLNNYESPEVILRVGPKDYKVGYVYTTNGKFIIGVEDDE